MVDKNKIEVFIGGRIYTLLGEESQEYMQKVALYIDKKMAQIVRSDRTNALSTTMIATLTSINVADDLFKHRESSEKFQKELLKTEKQLEENEKIIGQYEDELGKMQEENIALRKKLDEMQLDMMKIRMEFEEYISTFDENHKASAEQTQKRIK